VIFYYSTKGVRKMLRIAAKLSGLFVILALLATSQPGCLTTGGQLISTISPDVDQLPATVGFYPMLSSRLLSSRSVPRGWPLKASMSRSSEEIYIVPPAESELIVTSYSRMMTDLISKDMLYYGFDLRELPVEIPENGSSDDNDRTFSISLSLLEHLREEYNVQAIMIGNALFSMNPYSSSVVEVHSAHVKVVDIETLKVLCQVDFTYSDSGQDIEIVSDDIAASLASMAGLETERRER
jgi:hypothetical protein